jgi:hypothetical protein
MLGPASCTAPPPLREAGERRRRADRAGERGRAGALRRQGEAAVERAAEGDRRRGQRRAAPSVVRPA